MDVAKRQGTDQIVGLIEEVTAYAPEVASIMGRTITGTSYKPRIRLSFPTAGFRRPGAGVPLGKSEYSNKLIECAFLDAQMQVDEAMVDADNPLGSLLADEASGATKQSMLTIGSQFYYGNPVVNPDTDLGFPGLQYQVRSDFILDATGSTANAATSVYIICEGLQGVHLIFGNGGELSMPQDWTRQQVSDSSGNKYFAWVNNLKGWPGLNIGSDKSVVRIKNITAQTGKGVTDALIQTALAIFPVGMTPTKILMNRTSRLQLQISRTAVSQQAYKLGAIADMPTEVNGVPIVVTDSIISTEAIS